MRRVDDDVAAFEYAAAAVRKTSASHARTVCRMKARVSGLSWPREACSATSFAWPNIRAVQPRSHARCAESGG